VTRNAKEQYSRKSANFLAIRFDLLAYNKMAQCWLATLDLSLPAAYVDGLLRRDGRVRHRNCSNLVAVVWLPLALKVPQQH
jgi:hypothetical protein